MVDAKTEGWIEIAQRGFENWKAKPHNARWFRKIDGTPIPNDLTICIGEAFAEPLRSLSLRVEAEKRERERLKDRIDLRMNDYLVEMREGYDDSITGFNEAWDIVRSVFADMESNNAGKTDG